MPSVLEQAHTYYKNLLAYEYRDAPRAGATIELLSKNALCDLFALEVQNAFNLDTAVGAQLDVIGKYVGIPRNIGDPAAQPFFGYWDTNISGPDAQNVNGYQRSNDPDANPNGLYFRARQQGSRNTDLTDDAYRFMIKLKIVTNQMDSSLASIDNLMHDFFSDVIVVSDNVNMSLSYDIYGPLPVSAYTLTPYLPRPMGCGITITSHLFAVVSTTSVGATAHKAWAGETPDMFYATQQVIVTVGGGVAPYSITWEKLSDTNTPSFFNPSIFSDYAWNWMAPRFSAIPADSAEGTCVTTWVGHVTDSAGNTVDTPVVTATFIVTYP